MKIRKKILFQAAKQSTNANTWEKYYSAKKTCLSAVRSAKHTFFTNDLPKILRENCKKFWKVINPTQARAITLADNSGDIMTDTVPFLLTMPSPQFLLKILVLLYHYRYYVARHSICNVGHHILCGWYLQCN